MVGTWAALPAIGWALVFWPQLPQGFNFSPQLDPDHSSFIDALYVSLVNLTSLDYGDISPASPLLRRRLKIPGDTTAETLRHYQSDHAPLRA